MSSTVSPASVRNSMKNVGSFSGNRAGCGFTPAVVQWRRYDELLSVFGICRRFDGMAPPLSSAKRRLMSWPEGRSFGR